MKSLIIVLVLSVFCMAQSQQQPTPQQTVSALVSQQANLSAQIITVLNQVPDLIKQNQDLQAALRAARDTIASQKNGVFAKEKGKK
jgi:cell shape-determining protein MreC